MHYFLIIMLDGDVISYGKRCNEVDYENPKYLICKHQESDGSFECLGLIPHSQIRQIMTCNE